MPELLVRKSCRMSGGKVQQIWVSALEAKNVVLLPYVDQSAWDSRGINVRAKL